MLRVSVRAGLPWYKGYAIVHEIFSDYVLSLEDYLIAYMRE